MRETFELRAWLCTLMLRLPLTLLASLRFGKPSFSPLAWEKGLGDEGRGHHTATHRVAPVSEVFLPAPRVCPKIPTEEKSRIRAGQTRRSAPTHKRVL